PAGLATTVTKHAPIILGTATGAIAFPLPQAHLAAPARENRVRAFTLVFNVGPAVAFGISPLIAGGLIALYGMRSAFFFAALCTLFSIFFFARFKTAERPESERHDTNPTTYRQALAEPNVRKLLALQAFAIFGMSLGISLLPTFLNEARGIPPAIVAIMGGIGSVGSITYGLVVARSRKLQTFPLASIAIALLFVVATFAICLFAYSPWIIGLAFIGRGGLWSAWGLFVAALGEVARTDRIRPRIFTLSEMIGGTAFSAAPILSGQLYAMSPAFPLVAGIIACGSLVPVLFGLQKRLGTSLGPRASQLSPVESLEPEVA
ncbi:MAG: MFS transporter, partial [Chloroflexota bacterium]